MNDAFGTRFRTRACRLLLAGSATAALVLGGTPAFAEGPASPAAGDASEVARALDGVVDHNGESILDDAIEVDADAGAATILDEEFDGHSVELSGDPAEGFTATTDGEAKFSVGLPFADDAKAEVVEGQVHLDNQNQSTSVPQVLKDGQFRVLSVLETPSAPTRFEYRVDITGGGTVAATEDGGFVILNAAGEELSIATPPWAQDANGASVPTHYEISGNKVTQVVDTANLAADQFPIVADPSWSIITYFTKVVNVTSGSATKNLNKRIGTCSIGKGGGSCSISKGKTASRDISLSYGISRGAVSAALGISEGTSVTVTVSCTSPTLKAGSVYEGYAYGKFYNYKVEKWQRHTVSAKTTTKKVATSGTLTAFNPWASAIHCQVK